MTIVTKISGSSLNEKVKAEITKQFPTLTSMYKKHVPGVGYVFYLKQGEKTLGKVFKEGSQMVIFNDKNN